MLKRLGLGLLKGLIIGGAIGAGLQYGLHWTNASGLLGFLVSMGAAGTAGVFAGKAPWKEGAWIEATLKGMVGVGLGALAYWGLTYVPESLQIPFPGLAGSHALAALPAVFAPAIAGVYGALVELDDTGDDGKADKKKGDGPKARVAVDDDGEEAEAEAGRKRRDRRRRKA
ncbi:MAG: hypothetical protein KC619_09430 [Myxococcales bacterium]|nr:hypothetical protein [Myxococcales bacterium]